MKIDYQLPFGEKFAEAWQDWLAYRRKRKLPKYAYPERTLQAIIRDSLNNEENAIKAINLSIEQNWQGIFFKNIINGQQHNSTGSKPNHGSAAGAISLIQRVKKEFDARGGSGY